MRYLQSKSVFEHYLKIYEDFEPSKYESKLFSEPAHKIIIKYSNCL